MEQSHTFPPDVMQSLSVFLNLPLSLLTYKPSAVKFDDAATIDQHLQLEALIEQAQNILTSNVHVIVRRGEAACAVRGSVDCAPDPHPVFETLVQYDTLKPVYVAARRFDAYRRLFMDLYKGLAPLLCVCIHASMISSAAAWKGLFDEHRAQTALEEDLLKLEGQFPRTFKRSLFGIKLSDADLDNRCAGLNYWMSGILSRYYLLDIERRALVNDFLKLNTPKNVEEDERNKAILHALSSKRTRDSSMCTEGTIVYTQDTAVMSPGIAMPHRSSDEFSIPSVCEIPVEEVDYECTTLRAAPTRDPVTGDTLGDGQPTVFAFGPEEHHRQSNDTLETIRIESSENESRTTLHVRSGLELPDQNRNIT